MRLSEATRLLSDAGIDSPRENARKLFSHFVGIPQYRMIAEDPETENEALIDAIRRRADREPLQYIIGEVDFFREVYKVSPDCLIPRSDTEVLVEYAVRNIPDGALILDLCTGSGCVAISTLNNTNGTSAVAVDISAGALEIAKRNATFNKVGERVRFLQLDVLTEELMPGVMFDAILSNPPYVSDSAYASLEPEIFREPSIAFVGGDDGADFYRHITSKYKGRLKPGGFIAYEIGYDQSELISLIAKTNGMTVEIIRDISQNPRVAVLRPETK